MTKIEERKYNTEEVVWTAPTNICQECANHADSVNGVPGFNKVFCKAYPDRKPKGVNLGRVRECEKFKER